MLRLDGFSAKDVAAWHGISRYGVDQTMRNSRAVQAVAAVLLAMREQLS